MLKEGIDYVIENEKYVFTGHFLLKRGYCCHFKCRNCPYTKEYYMNKELYMNNKTPERIVIQTDDLKFDGTNLIIPSYWASTLADFIKTIDESKIQEDDKADLDTLKSFIFDVEFSKNSGN